MHLRDMEKVVTLRGSHMLAKNTNVSQTTTKYKTYTNCWGWGSRVRSRISPHVNYSFDSSFFFLNPFADGFPPFPKFDSAFKEFSDN